MGNLVLKLIEEIESRKIKVSEELEPVISLIEEKVAETKETISRMYWEVLKRYTDKIVATKDSGSALKYLKWMRELAALENVYEKIYEYCEEIYEQSINLLLKHMGRVE